MARHGKAVAIVLAALGLTAGCATRSFVQEELALRDAQLRGVETQLRAERERLGELRIELRDLRAQVQDASWRADRALSLGGQTATRVEEAADYAGRAFAKAVNTETQLGTGWMAGGARTITETVVVPFAQKGAELDDRAKKALVAAAWVLQAYPKVRVTMVGATAAKGRVSEAQLNQRRVEAVRRFLIQRGVAATRIERGTPAAPPPAGSLPAQKSRVMVQLLVPLQ